MKRTTRSKRMGYGILHNQARPMIWQETKNLEVTSHNSTHRVVQWYFHAMHASITFDPDVTAPLVQRWRSSARQGMEERAEKTHDDGEHASLQASRLERELGRLNMDIWSLDLLPKGLSSYVFEQILCYVCVEQGKKCRQSSSPAHSVAKQLMCSGYSGQESAAFCHVGNNTEGLSPRLIHSPKALIKIDRSYANSTETTYFLWSIPPLAICTDLKHATLHGDPSDTVLSEFYVKEGNGTTLRITRILEPEIYPVAEYPLTVSFIVFSLALSEIPNIIHKFRHMTCRTPKYVG
ncbi:hypothetical protein EDC04DRAFT_2610589 [Pisolithus marmoratus]|nr:hypothetical protein EDC04DRAFT_2610589 [Pisolithus marmoratus]